MCVRQMPTTERDGRRADGVEGGGRRRRRSVVGPSFVLNKTMMGDRLGTTSQAKTGLLPFVQGESLRRRGEGGLEGKTQSLNNVPSEREKYAGARGCVCAV